MTCRNHLVFDDPSCVYCNSARTRVAVERAARSAKNMERIAQAEYKRGEAERRQLKQEEKAAQRAEAKRAFRQSQQAKRQAQLHATEAARAAQGGGLLLGEKLVRWLVIAFVWLVLLGFTAQIPVVGWIVLIAPIVAAVLWWRKRRQTASTGFKQQ
ncbi:hypothetical protein MYP14_19030 [Rhodococcus pyridinivorans]|uniref:hypothetical protein n=1 Tax=Rhodococcus pyridinivorans TaxID=103816 RepID=UPI001FFEACC0|nr:hypothetical protein [Rhodococcus pyridinivorans]UPK62826.1 hypothetical protein MYP14_19030 [Rhodococcus pyridinivorans]